MQDRNGNSVDSQSDDALIDLTETELQIEQALTTPGIDEIDLSPDFLTSSW